MLTEELLRRIIREETGPRLGSLEKRVAEGFDAVDQRFDVVDQRFDSLRKELAGEVDEQFPLLGQRPSGPPTTPSRIAAKGS